MQGLQNEVEMTPQSKMAYMDELEHLDATPTRQRALVRSNSIVF